MKRAKSPTIIFLLILLGVASCGGNECNGPGMQECGGVCVDTSSSSAHCGSCYNACPPGSSCVNGNCQCAGEGTAFCGNQCVNIKTDNQHCGGCNRPCLGGSSCNNGVCTCGGNLTYCVDKCVNTKTDDAHCGECLHPCQSGQHCFDGKCVTPHPEFCDGIDNDFDGSTDEDDNGQPLTRSCDNLCGKGTETCIQGKWQNCTAPAPKDETCNGKDDDCDGLTDEDVATRWYEDYDRDGYGDPDEAYSILACSKPADGTSPNGGNWSDKNTDCNDGYPCYDPDNPDQTIDCDPAQIHPGATESCDKVDNNCNGNIDENCACSPVGGTRPCGTDEGECVKGTQQCTANGWGECGGAGYVSPKPETCNGKDDDCDGKTDEELADDTYENDDTCNLARRLPEVVEGSGWSVLEGLSIYHGAEGSPLDEDWFVVKAREISHLECLWNWGKEQCDFIFTIALTVPSDADHEKYVFCVHAGGQCGAFDYTFCSNDQPGAEYNPNTHTYTMALAWNGMCNIDDSWEFYVQVKGKSGTNLNNCAPYKLTMRLDWAGQISDTCE